MQTVEWFNAAGRDLQQKLLLRFPPVAFRLLYGRDEVPEGATVPLKDTGHHLALCQAFAMARRNRACLAMFKEDNWCVWPNACFGLCPLDEEDEVEMGTKLFMSDPQKSLKFFREKFPRLKSERKPAGFAVSPLDTCPFVPDVVVVYCRVSQLRTLIMAAKFQDGDVFDVLPDTVASCCHATIPLLSGRDYNVAIPDPGEYERSLADEDEIIFSVRADRLENLLQGLASLEKIRFGYAHLKYDMNLDYPRAEFYNTMSRKWGLDTGETWDHGK